MKQIDEYKQELIESYFDGALTENKMEEFRQNMESQDFREAVAFHRELLDILKKERANHPLKKMFQEEERAIQEKKRAEDEPVLAPVVPLQTTPVVPLWRRVAVAASVLFLIVAGYFVYLSVFGTSGSIEQYPLIASSVIWPEDDSKLSPKGEKSALEKGRDAYFEGMHKESIRELATIDPNDPDYFEGQYFLAHAHLARANFEEAISGFDFFIDQPDRLLELPEDFRNLSALRWNRMLAYRATGNKEAFQNELDQFLNGSDEKFKEKATQLIREQEE